jgi:hypothetical protein
MGQGLGGGQAKGAGLRGIVLLVAPSGSRSNGFQVPSEVRSARALEQAQPPCNTPSILPPVPLKFPEGSVGSGRVCTDQCGRKLAFFVRPAGIRHPDGWGDARIADAGTA